MCVRDRLIKFIEYKGITQRQFYIKAGLSSGFLNKNKSIGSSKINKIIHAYPELCLEWLIMGKGNMLHEKEKQNTQYSLPLLDVSTVVREPDLSRKDKSIIPIDHFSLGRGYEDCQAAIHVWGNEMKPEFCTGDITVLRKIRDTDHFQWGFAHLVIIKNRQYFFNRVGESRNEKKIYLFNDQPSSDDVSIGKEDIIRAYEVRAIIRKYAS